MLIENPSDFYPYKKNRSRLLSLDVGSKTIGLALSDLGWMIATPYETLRRTKFSKDIVTLQNIVQEHGIIGFVVGYPLNMDGSKGPRCQSTDDFIKNVESHLDLPILKSDERLSTVAVTRTLLDADVSRKKRAEVVDKMAAGFILQGVLDRLNKK